MSKSGVVGISGARGFIGSYLNQYFAGKGYEVKPLHRDIFQEGRLPELIRIISSCNIVINLAGASILHPWTSGYKKKLYNSRINTTSLLVKAMKAATIKPTVFISASAIGYYPSSGCYDEYNSVNGEGFLSGLCEEWEKVAIQASPDVRTVITRLGIIFDTHGGAFPKMALSTNFKISAVIGSGRQYLSWMSLIDLGEAMNFLIEHPDLSGVFNFTVPEQITYKEFANMIKEHSKAIFSIRIPDILIQIVLGEASAFLTQTPCVKPTRLQEEGFHYHYPGLSTFLESI